MNTFLIIEIAIWVLAGLLTLASSKPSIKFMKFQYLMLWITFLVVLIGRFVSNE